MPTQNTPPDLDRYSVIHHKNKREILLLRGTGCFWRRCSFCDYHLDASPNQAENDALNLTQLAKVTGVYNKLEIINSGSFPELSKSTLQAIKNTCLQKDITSVHFESHWHYRKQIQSLRDFFAVDNITTKLKIGIETFDTDYRELHLHKGITTSDPQHIAQYFDECCLLFGLTGQTTQSMLTDIQTALNHFERVCINIMVQNSTPVKPDNNVIQNFITDILPTYNNNPRVDILLANTDFGVGGSNQ